MASSSTSVVPGKAAPTPPTTPTRSTRNLDIFALPLKLRRTILEQTLTHNRPIIYLCPHDHDWQYCIPNTPYDHVNVPKCTHMDNGFCAHNFARPSYIPVDGEYMFWSAVVANRQIYAEAALMLPMLNTVSFTIETLTCFNMRKWQPWYYPDARERLSEQIRSVELIFDFTGTEKLADMLDEAQGVRDLTISAEQTWLTPMMLSDFLDVVNRLPSLRTCRIDIIKGRLRSCSFCGAKDACEGWTSAYYRLIANVDWMNGKLAEALGKRAAKNGAVAAVC